ncbi:MAG: alpha-L-fucosidase [Muribaculaceae bacterium]
MKLKLIKHVCCVAAIGIACSTSALWAQTPTYTPAPENLEARKQFQDDKFGIFLHWGIYSMLAQGEWAMTNQNLNRDEYSKLASGFYPSRFNAHDWVAAFKAAGARYICITSRHHDGFSMFHTKQSPYNIVDATPFKRDILKEIADECHKQGIALHIYYSHLDWYREDYYPLGSTGHGTGRKNHGEWSTYYKFMNDQLAELLTNYGKVRAIWFDGYWDKKDFDWGLPEQYAHIHSIQPGCMIGNNHHITPFAGEDFQMFERDLPGENTAGLSGQEVSRLPLETCETMNGMWGYKITDQNYKSTKTLIHLLVKAAGRNANLLMNIGPQPNGELPATALLRLKEMGEWLNRYGETVYGTRGGLVAPHDWGVTTIKDNKLYVHILDLKDSELYLPLTERIASAKLFSDGTPVKYTVTKQGIVLNIGEISADEIDHIVEITLKK